MIPNERLRTGDQVWPEKLDQDEAPWGVHCQRPLLVPAPMGHFQLWDHPVEGRKYVIGADVAEGKVKDAQFLKKKAGFSLRADRPDYSAAAVLELESAQHVASWHGYCEPSEWAGVLAALGYYYNTAELVPEINGPGLGAVDVLVKVLRYPALYRAKIWNRAEADDNLGTDFGWRTTMVNRPMLIQRIHEWIAHAPFTRDAELVKELRTMEYDERGTARARNRNKDDRVIALGLGLQARYEALHGRVSDAPDTKRSADPYTAWIWDRIKAQQKIQSDARNGNRDSRPRRVRRLGVRPLPSW